MGMGAAVVFRNTMRRHLQPLPRPDELPEEGGSVTVVSKEARRVLYIEGDPSLDVIMAALEAWGLKVRSERERASREGVALVAEGSVERNEPDGMPAWVTRRPALPRVSRLENRLSPIWFPARLPLNGNEPVTAFNWFGRAA